LPISQKAGQSPATLCFPGSRTDASPRKDGDDDEEEEEKEEELEEEEE
jgi:ribosomal protein L12E/L44/L45/RPP1/RPP2